MATARGSRVLRTIPLILIVALLCPCVYGRAIYVDHDVAGANNGSSWADAYWCLQDALAGAQPGDEIRVAQGTYRPDQRVFKTRGGSRVESSGDRTATFRLINAVTIKGGYAGFGQPDPDVRDIELYETILSGDLNGDDRPGFANNAENSYHVVTGSGANETAVLEGFTVTAGNANGSSPNQKGGGMNSDSGSPTLVNCTFSENWATTGGGMSNSRNSSPTVIDCTFSSNSAANNAGGMRNNSSSPTVTNCTFSGNSANRGGGMNNRSGEPNVTDCTFIGNVSDDKGGAMRNANDSSPSLTNCTFSGNYSDSGGAMYNDNSNPTLTDCVLSGNSADKGGGAMNNWQSSPTLTNCTFSDNTAGWAGGAIDNVSRDENTESSPTVTNCTFIGNSAGWDGGGMENVSSHPTLINCVFSENSATEGAGGMHNADGSHPNITNCTFSGNSADKNGGAMTNRQSSHPNITNCTFSNNSSGHSGGAMCDFTESSPTLTNCTFSGNSARWDGGGIKNMSSRPTLTNCIFSQNSAEAWGGGISNSDSSNPVLSNCIVWGNAAQHVSQIHQDDTSLVTITYSDVQGGWPGQGNISADPFFAIPGYRIAGNPRTGGYDVWVAGDYHLKSEAGRWDPDSETWVADDMTSYGGTAEASKSFPGLYEKYGGGTGEPNDPYLIYTTEQMNAVGAEPNDWGRHFKLMADLDLSAFSYYAAPIAPDTDTVREDFQGTAFTGVFDGNGHTISHLTITGESYVGLFGKLDPGATILNLRLEAADVSGTGNIVGGLAGANSGTIVSSYSTGKVTGGEDVGGLVGYNRGNIGIVASYSAATVTGDKWVGGLVGYSRHGNITGSYSTGTVTGGDYVGGMMGGNDGGSSVADSYSTGTVSGNKSVGGLVGINWGSSITGSYSAGAVTGNYYVGGLAGENRGVITESFWDIETSGQPTSAAGMGKTTSEMQTAETFLEAGWDFVDETANGTDDIWRILEGRDYPRLWWE
ncbi:MAG: right-handed parallel beta-helix repeat-containing protein [Planctomycetota bacterium]